ncbi:MAG TPA: helix-turn-helix domain-containing protein [Yaniella sp.]
MSAHARALKFLQHIVRNLPAEDQLGYVLSRIAAEVDTAVLIFDGKGELIGSIGGAPTELIWESVDTGLAESQTRVGRWVVRARPLGPNREGYSLVFATRVADDIDAPKEIIEAAEIAVNAVLAVIRSDNARWVRENAELLEILEKGVPQAREHRFWSRLSEHGFTPHTSFVLIVDEDVTGEVPSSDFLWNLHEKATRSEVPLLAATRLTLASSDAVVHMLVPDTEATQLWLRKDFSGRAMGISASHYSLTEVPIGLREAEDAYRVAMNRAKAQLNIGRESERIKEVAVYGELRMGAWGAVVAPVEEFRARTRHLLAPFDHHSEILETLIIHLANSFSVNATARQLFLHSNTVRYRLARAEELLGDSLSSPLVITDLTLALEAEIKAYRHQL